MKKRLLLVTLLCCASPALAQINYFQYSGHIETSYNYLLRSNEFTSYVHNRLFDLQQNGFTLQQAELNLSITPPQGLGAVGGLMVGRDPYAIAPYGWDPYFGSQTLGIVITNAYVQYALNQLTLMGGLYNSQVGIEFNDSTLNTNFSRSLLAAFAEPGFMVGVRSLYTVNPNWKLSAGVCSGWSTMRFATHYPSLEYGVNYTATPQLAFMLQGLSGQQHLLTYIATGPVSRRDMWELTGTYKMTTALTLQAGYDYGIQRKALLPFDIGQAVWQGVSAYVNYQYNDQWQSSVRGEIYNDGNGYTTGVRQNLRELTLTLGYQPIKSILIRAETRHDISNVSSFINASGNGTSNNQQSYALEGNYLF